MEEIERRVAEMRKFFQTHDWIKGILTHTKDLSVTGACLAGAEREVAGDWNVVTPAIGEMVLSEYPERIDMNKVVELELMKHRYIAAAVQFNNHMLTTKEEMLSCLERVSFRVLGVKNEVSV